MTRKSLLLATTVLHLTWLPPLEVDPIYEDWFSWEWGPDIGFAFG